MIGHKRKSVPCDPLHRYHIFTVSFGRFILEFELWPGISMPSAIEGKPYGNWKWYRVYSVDWRIMVRDK